jgi:hypothetical protein
MTERKGVTGRIRYSGSSGRTYSRSKAKLQDVDAGLWVVISSVCPSAHFTRCLQTKTLYQHADNRDPHRLPGVDQSVSSLFLIFIFIVSRPPPCRRISRRRRMTCRCPSLAAHGACCRSRLPSISFSRPSQTLPATLTSQLHCDHN